MIRKYGVSAAVVNLQSPFPYGAAPAAGWDLVEFDAQSALYASPELARKWPKLDVTSRVREIEAEMDRWCEAAQIQSSQRLVDAVGAALGARPKAEA